MNNCQRYNHKHQHSSILQKLAICLQSKKKIEKASYSFVDFQARSVAGVPSNAKVLYNRSKKNRKDFIFRLTF